MKIGYARVSTTDQKMDLQIDGLNQAGCEKIFHEEISTRKAKRIELERALEMLRKGDVLIVWKLDRIARSLKELIQILEHVQKKGADFKSLNDPIDTTSASGRLLFNVLGAFAEFERDIIRERTMAGLSAAKQRGRVGGRPKGLSDKAKLKANAAATLYKEGEFSIQEIIEQLQISKTTLYNYLRYKGIEPNPLKKAKALN